MPIMQIIRWTATVIEIMVQHPAVTLRLTRVDALAIEPPPQEPGCYTLLDIPVQAAYAGTSDALASRVPRSIASNLAGATHVLTITAVGMPLTDAQRHGLETRLIRSLPTTVNRVRGRAPAADPYLDSVAAIVLPLIAMLLPSPSRSRGDRVAPTQGRVAQRLVAQEVHHPYTLGELTARLRALGWPAGGRSVHRTLRRDLCDESRGGSDAVAVTGPWTDPGTTVFWAGRKYTSGWSPVLDLDPTGPMAGGDPMRPADDEDDDEGQDEQ